jgi:hypothetical protein
MWIIAAAVGAAVFIAGIKHFGGTAAEEETMPRERLARREAKPEHSGWSVRSGSTDLASSDDVQVPRRVEAQPANGASRGSRSAELRGGQPVAGSGAAVAPAAPRDGAAAGTTGGPVTGADPAAANGGVQGKAPAAAARPGVGVVTGEGAVAHNPEGSEDAPAIAEAGGTEQQPTGDPAAQGTPGQDHQTAATPAPAATPAEVAIGAMYDSKDTTFSIDTPVEVKDIGPISGHGVTMTMTLAPDWAPDSQDDADFLKLGDNLELGKNVHFLRLRYFDADGAEHVIGTDITKWQDIQPPYSIAATVNGNQLALVVNGQLVAHGTTEGAPYEPPADPTLQIGCVDYPTTRPCASGGANAVRIVPPMSNAESMAFTKPPPAGHR